MTGIRLPAFNAPLIGALLMSALLLAGCGDDKADIRQGPDRYAGQQGLVYSYPAPQQIEVPASAPLVLRFSSEITASHPESRLTLLDGEGETVAFSHREVGEGRGLVLVPEARLAPLSEYTLQIEALSLAAGEMAPTSFSFTTGAAAEGPREQMASSTGFTVQRQIPDGEALPILAFSNFRLLFTQPLARDTVRYGDTLSLTDSEGALVPAQVLVRGRHLTLDPLTELLPGEDYTLQLLGGIRSAYGDALDAYSLTFSPQDTGNRSTMVQEVPDAQGGAVVSPLTGEPVNMVPMASVLLGEDNSTQQSGDIRAELAHIPTFPDTSPLRIARGSRLSGTSLEVLIGGAVPAGFDSGAVEIQFVSDAMGYMLENPYSSLPGAPRWLKLYMDVAITTEDPRANAAVTQNLMHLELVGTVFVEEGRLVVDAVGVAEPRILGDESARSVLSFSMRSYLDQNHPPPPLDDTTPPELQSGLPGTHPELIRPGDPLVLNFTKVLDPTTLVGRVHLYENGLLAETPRVHTDGAALVIRPVEPLIYSPDATPREYSLVLEDGITDLAGNALAVQEDTFALPTFVTEQPRAPVVLSAYPGFPCVTEQADLANHDAGRCLGGKPDDDHLPLARLPADRSLRVTFSQDMDPDSVTADTLVVEEIDAAGDPVGDPVDGQVTVGMRTLTFTPTAPWTVGSLYRYTLRSSELDPVCGSDAICDRRGLPLQTRLLAQTPDEAVPATAGGPDMAIHFLGAPPSHAVMQALRNLPGADVNANFVLDAGETLPSVDPMALANSTRLSRNPDANPDADGTAASGNALRDANVGCGFDADDAPLDCPDETYLFLNGNLDVEVYGYVPPEDIDAADPGIPDQVKDQGGVLAYIHPTQVLLSGTVVHVELSDIAASLNFEALPAQTGPQVMRMRYTCNAASGECEAPDYGRIKGWIVEEAGEARFMAQLSLYLDAPELDPEVVNHNLGGELLPVAHNLRSYPLTLELSGALTFLDDGRLQIRQQNLSPIALTIELEIGQPVLLTGALYLGIETGDAQLEYVSEPIISAPAEP
ncbi:Ig-like domain-containing protein [Alcanivorax sp. JB21]|uniref:Ig-like domain-containing protein n=1 Tax=Alcanivorax limicola TaxID=2874102 RepID=UPI001CBA94F8|nr:Ig-like domain-containing protein [Alcanivorax limicola]MBZ2187497.1 Ig-like domain-containing protein [Alcanivorax limicola]